MSRRFFITKDGYMGLGPLAMKEGDAVVFLFGGVVPYLLRPDGDMYMFIGDCYSHMQENGGIGATNSTL
jgi:hypothetical protein